MHNTFIIILITLGFILLFSFLNFLLSIHPPRYTTVITPKDLSLNYESISFTTQDNLLIKGWFIPNNKTDKVLIILHGYPFDKGNIMQATYFLADHFNLLYFDFRYFGESQGKYTSVGYHEQKDLKAAVAFLKQRNFTKIGSLGFSLGAATILMTNSPQIKAIVADSSYANIDKMIKRTYFIFPSITKMPFIWLTKLYAFISLRINTSKISPLKEIPNIQAPILLIHATEDTQIPVENSKLLYEASNKNTTELLLIKGDHGASISNPEYEKRIIEFFNRNL